MTTVQQREAARITEAFQAALAAQSVEAIVSAIEIWQRTPADIGVATAGSWLQEALQLILTKRSRSREIGLAYYRLVRALRTGKTIVDNRRPEPKYITISQLRREFELLVEGKEIKPDEYDPADESNGVEVEKVVDIRDYMERDDEFVREAARESLLGVGPRYKDAQREKAAKSGSPEELHKTAGNLVAGSSQRHVANGARHLVDGLSKSDTRAIGFVRVSKTGTPCGFCAMLISRGPVFYKTRQSAGDRDYGGTAYHDNCQCVSEPVFSTSQYDNSPIYAMNREYHRLWKDEIAGKGLTGNDALNAWRRLINARYRQAANQDAQAA